MLAVLMGVGFTSCGKDGGDDTGVAKEKKLVKLVSPAQEKTFKYDAQGHLIEAVDVYLTAGYTVTDSYVWGEDKIDIARTMKVTATGEDVAPAETVTVNLENGLATDVTGASILLGATTLTYGSSGRLVDFKGFVSNLSLEWNGDKLMSISDSVMGMTGSVDTFTYETNTVTKGYNPLVPTQITVNYLFMAHPELAGIKTQYLPDRSVSDGSAAGSEYVWTSDYTYEFDEDGYVTKIADTNSVNGSETEDLIYTVVWE